MRVKRIGLNNVKSFTTTAEIVFDNETSIYSLSGRNGAGKSTFLKSVFLIQKAYFSQELGLDEWKEFKEDAQRYLNTETSSISVTFEHDGDIATLSIFYQDGFLRLSNSNRIMMESVWDIKKPENLILYIDASKGFSEKTLSFSEVDISNNSKSELALTAIMYPEKLFSGIYQQLITDYVHDRLIPQKPDRLIYQRLASKIFSSLVPNVEIKNFSGKYKTGEFVLLGKVNSDKRIPLYDVREFSSGEKALLSTLCFLCISNSVSSILIDEPENHFHEGLLLEFIGFLNEISDEDGLLGWAKRNSQIGPEIKEEWLESEYSGKKINQIFLSTHSKTLIYKLFSIGKNFSLNNEITELHYIDAEENLRSLGLSTINERILLVEGKSDQEALNYILRDKNITIKALEGGRNVIETFKRIAEIRPHIKEIEIIFLVDSDNKPNSFFDRLREIDRDFYDSSFIKLEKHEVENYLLCDNTFHEVIFNFLKLSDKEHLTPTKPEILEKFILEAKNDLYQLYKKEISLLTQQSFEHFLSTEMWGDKSFKWNDEDTVIGEIEKRVFEDSKKATFLKELKQKIAEELDKYSSLDGAEHISRCDGKKIFRIVSGNYAKLCGISPENFRRSIYKYSINNNHEFIELGEKIKNSFR